MSEYGEDLVKAAEQAFQSPTTLVYKRRVKHSHYVATRAADELFRSPTTLTSKRSMRSSISPQKSRESRIRDLLDPRSSSPLRSAHSTLSAETTPYILSDLSRHSSVGRRYQSLIQNDDQKALFHQMKNSLVVKLRTPGEKTETKSKPKVKKTPPFVYCGGCTDMVSSRPSGTDDEANGPDSDEDNSILLLPNCPGFRQPPSPKRRHDINVSFDESSSWSTRSTRSTRTRSTRSTAAESILNRDPSLDEQAGTSSQCDGDDSVLTSRKKDEKKLSSYARFFNCMGGEWSQSIDSPKHDPLPTLREDGFNDAVSIARREEAEEDSSDESSVDSIEDTRGAESQDTQSIAEAREESQDTHRSEGTVERLASPIITATSGDCQQVEMSVKPSYSTQELETDGSQGDPCTKSSDMSARQSFESDCDVEEKHSIEQVEAEFESGRSVVENPSNEQVESKSTEAHRLDESDTSIDHQQGGCDVCDVEENHSIEQVRAEFESGRAVVENPSSQQVESKSTEANRLDERDTSVDQLQGGCDVDKKPSREQVESESTVVKSDGVDMSLDQSIQSVCDIDEKPSSDQSKAQANVAGPPDGSDMSAGQPSQNGCDVDEKPLSEQVESESNVAKPDGGEMSSDQSLQRFCRVDEKPSSDQVESKSTIQPDGSDMATAQSIQRSGCDVDVQLSSAQVESKSTTPPDGSDIATAQSLQSGCDVDVELSSTQVEVTSIVTNPPDVTIMSGGYEQAQEILPSGCDQEQELVAVERRPSIVEISSIDSPVGMTGKTDADESNEQVTPVFSDEKPEEKKDDDKTFQCCDEEVGRLPRANINPSMELPNLDIKDIVCEGPLSEPSDDQQEHTFRSYPSDEFSPGARDHFDDKGSKADIRAAQQEIENKVTKMKVIGESILEATPDDLRSDSQESSVTLKAGTRSAGNSRESTPKGETGPPGTQSSSGTPRTKTTRPGTPTTTWGNKDRPVEETDDDMQLVLELPLVTGEAVEVKFFPEGRAHTVLLSPKERDGALSPKERELLPALFDTRSDPSNNMSWSPDSGSAETARGESLHRNIYARFQQGPEMFSFSDADISSEPSSAKSISGLRVSPAEYDRNSPSSYNDASSLETFDRLVSPSSGGSVDEVESEETNLKNAHLRSLIQRLSALPTLADDQRPETPIPLRSYTELGITQDLSSQDDKIKDYDSIAKSFRQRDESSKDDLSFMVKAKFVSEFFRSKIVSGEGEIRMEAGDREMFEGLLPASDQLHFIESLRFRVGALSEAPTTLLQRLALRCKKLGLHRKGAKNPILAIMALTDKSVSIRVDSSSAEDDLLPTDSLPSSPHIDEVLASVRSGSDSDLAVHLATFDRLMAIPPKTQSVDPPGESPLEQIDTWESSLDNQEAFRGTLQRVSALATLSEDGERTSSPFRGYADLGITENPTISFDLKSDITNVLEGHTATEPSLQDLRSHDFAYLITASMLVKFFQSRIDFDEGRINLKPEDRITFEQLFPHSSILNFVDTVRFRVKEAPTYPVTQVELVTVQCEELGLHREGGENPIFVTLSLTNEPAFVHVTCLAEAGDEDSSSPNSRTLGSYFLSVFSTDKGMISPLNSMCMSPSVRSPTAMPTLAVLEEEKTVDSETNRDSFKAPSTDEGVADGKAVDESVSGQPITTAPPRNITLRETVQETDIQASANDVELGLALHNRPSDEILADRSAMMKELEEDEILFHKSSSKTPPSSVRDSPMTESIVPSYSSDDECSDDESADQCSVEEMGSVFDDAPSISDLDGDQCSVEESVEGMGSVFDDPPSISDLDGSGSVDEVFPRPKIPVYRADVSEIQDPSKKDSDDGATRRLPFLFGSGSSEENLSMWGYVLDSHLFVVRSEDEEMRSRHETNSSICSVERGLDQIWSGVEEWRDAVPVEDTEFWTWEGASDAGSNGEFWTTCGAGSHMKYRPSCCNAAARKNQRKENEESKNNGPHQENDKTPNEQDVLLKKIGKLWFGAFGPTKKSTTARSDDSTTTSLPDLIGAYACYTGRGEGPRYANCSTDDFSLSPSRVSTTCGRQTTDSPWHIILPTHFTKCANENDLDLQDDDSIVVGDNEKEVVVRKEAEIYDEKSSVSSWSRVSYYSESSADPLPSPWQPLIPVVRCRRSKLALRKAKLGRPSLIADLPKRRRKARGVIL